MLTDSEDDVGERLRVSAFIHTLSVLRAALLADSVELAVTTSEADIAILPVNELTNTHNCTASVELEMHRSRADHMKRRSPAPWLKVL